MKRMGALVAIIATILAGSLLAPAGADSKQQKRYEFTPQDGGGITGWYGSHYGVFFGDSEVFTSSPGDRFAIVHVDDDSGQPISAAVWQKGRKVRAFCGHGRVPITGGRKIHVQVFLDLTPAEYGGCEVPARPTSGTIIVRTLR